MRESTAVVATKWVGLAAAIWVQASAGNAYMFAFYSPALKAALHYNQVQLNNLGVAKDFGENVGLVAGLLCNRLPPWVLLCTGALFGCVGYGTLWLVVSEQIAPLPYWQMLVLQCIGSNSATWFNTAVLVTCMRNFPHSRGTVVGILKGFVGLSAAIFAQVHTALLAGNAALLLLFLATAPTSVCLASMLLVRPVRPKVRDPEEHHNFNYITGVCVALAGYLLVITFTEKLMEMWELVPVVLTTVMVAFLVAPLAIPVRALFLEYCCSEPLLGEEKVSADKQIQEPLLDDDSQLRNREKYSADEHMIQGPLLSDDPSQTSIHEKSAKQIQEPPLVNDESFIQEKSAQRQIQEPLILSDERLIQAKAAQHQIRETLLVSDESTIDEKSAQRQIQESLLVSDESTIQGKSAQGSTYMERKKVTLHEGVVAKLMNQEEDDAETLLAVGEGAVKRPKRRPRRGEDFKLRQALVKADFWLLFLTFFCGVGTGVTVINNLGQIGEAQGYYNVNIFVSLISIANFLGRLGGGSLSEHYIRSDAIPRTVWMGVAQTLLTFVHLMFASALPGTLYLGSILLGLCYGVHFSIMVPTASELFGLKHFGMIYNSLTIANPLGSFLFSGLIAGYLYDREAGHGVVCTGAHCFRLTFYVMACVCSAGVALTCVLTYRIRRVYVALYRKSPHPSSSDLQALE